MRSTLRLPVLLAAALAVQPFGAALQAQEHPTTVPDLFEPTTLGARELRSRPYIVQSRPVLVRLDLLASLSPQAKLNLNLFPDFSFVGVVQRVDRRSDMRFTVAGRLEDNPSGSFTIVVEEDVAVANIRVPGRSRFFSLRYVGDGIHLVSRIDSTKYPPCAGGVAPKRAPGAPQPAINVAEGETSPDQPETGARGGICPSPDPVFDVMIFYTPAARTQAGGTNAINGLCQLAIVETNEIYANSAIPARVRLVYRGLFGYTESGTLAQIVADLKDPDDGVLDGVHWFRDIYRADFVSLWVTDVGSGAGWGYCFSDASFAFSVVRWDSATGNYSFAHEIGHNQGCGHDFDDPDLTCDLYSYSTGWRWTGDDAIQYRSVMAKQGGWSRVQYFSNPNVEHEGQPTGVPNVANNAWTITLTSGTVEAYRLTRFDIWVDFSYGGTEAGSWTQPYNTVPEGVSEIINGPGASEDPTLWLKPGVTSETLTISKPMMIRVCGGPATIGS